MFGPCLVVQYLTTFLVLQSSWWEREWSCCYTLSSWCLVTVIALRLFLKVLWVGLQFWIVVFHDDKYFFICFPCADPESLARGSPTFFLFFLIVGKRIQIALKVDHNWIASETPFLGGPMMAQHSMLAWQLCDFSGDPGQYYKEPLYFVIFHGVRGPDSLSHLWILTCFQNV